MKFNNTQDALAFGASASEAEKQELREEMQALAIQFKNGGSFDERMQIATWHQLCREALQV